MACLERGDAFLAVTGGEKVHHGNLVERVWLGVKVLRFGQSLAQQAANWLATWVSGVSCCSGNGEKFDGYKR